MPPVPAQGEPDQCSVVTNQDSRERKAQLFVTSMALAMEDRGIEMTGVRAWCNCDLGFIG